MEKKLAQQFKLELLKTTKQFYVENNLNQDEMKYFLSLVLCDLAFIEDDYDAETFAYAKQLSKN